MSLQGKIKRYTLIIDLLNRVNYPSLHEIREYVYNFGFEISIRTIQRDIEQLRLEFGIDILYDHNRKGYYIDTDDDSNVETFLGLLQIVHNAEIITESILENKTNLSFISFDKGSGVKGIENLKPLISAIKQSLKVEFKHQNYSTGKISDYYVSPYFLKQYEYRWYLLATVEPNSEIRTFGLDRIHSLIITSNLYNRNFSDDYSRYFEGIIGVTHPEKEPEEVVLFFTPIQGKYVKSAPIHSSQRIIAENEEGILVSLFLYPNIELKQRILMLGAAVEVIKPLWLIEELVNIYDSSIKKYKNK